MFYKIVSFIYKLRIYFLAIIIAGFFVLLFLFNPTPTQASQCEFLNSSLEVQTGFGAAYNTLSVSKETLITADCATDFATITVGNGQATQYIYKYGYIWKNDKWEIMELTPAGTSLGVWLVGKANINIPLSSEALANENSIVAYICSWTGTTWKCGCRDAYCVQNYWQLQKFKKDACIENWTCTDWMPCVNLSQTKVCTDQNNCGTIIDKPLTSQSCTDECQDTDDDTFDNCNIGEAGDDGKQIDCDDNERHAYPGNKENCDTIDNNCNSQIDENCDKDIDGYCDEIMTLYRDNSMCPNTLFSANGQTGDDCDDNSKSVNPGAIEICDSIDNNCNNQTDEGCSCVNNQTQACGSDTGECQKGIRTCVSGEWGECVGGISTQTEICDDSKDNDCDSKTDCDDTDCFEYSACAPADIIPPQVNTFNINPATVNTNQPITINYAISDNEALKQIELWRATDLNEAPNNSNWTKVNTEIISGISVSGNFTDSISSAGTYWYGIHAIDEAGNVGYEPNPPGVISATVNQEIICQDSDNDGYDTCNIGEAGDDGKVIDCDDAKWYMNPGAPETCDGNDNNCDNQTDENCDDDNDNYCDSNIRVYNNPIPICPDTNLPDDSFGDDCDDDNIGVNPGKTEICGNSIDEDCDGSDLSCANVYHIAADGNDTTGDGSETNPWKTISKVNSMSFKPGDAILFKKGDVWREQLTISSSGNSTDLITFDAYGSGNKPVIDASLTYWWSVNTNGKNYIEVKNIETKNSISGGMGIRVMNSHDIWINNNYVHHANHGIRVRATSGNTTYNVYVDNNLVNYNQNGIYVDTDLASEDYNIYITNNTCEYNGEAGIRITINVHDSLIQRNIVKYSGSNLGTAPVWGTGIEIAGYSSNYYPYNITVEYNDVSNTIDVDLDGTDGVGIRFDDYTRTSVAQFNYVYDNEGNGMADSNKNGHGNIIRTNLIVNNNKNSTSWPSQENAGIILNNGLTGTGNQSKIYDNIVIGGDRGIYVYASFDVDLKNNLIYNSSNEGILFDDDVYDNTTYTEDHNLVYGFGTYLIGRIANYATITNVTSSVDSTDIMSDPLFVNESGNMNTPADFHLQPTSPAINTGIDVGLTEDLDGVSVPQGSAPDIGAYEYSGVTEDVVTPKVVLFTLDKTTINANDQITINYTVTDNKALNRIELWQTTDLNGAPNNSNWTKVNIEIISGTSASGSFTDSILTAGTYWYGMHVVDNAEPENIGYEPTPPGAIKVVVNQEIICQDSDNDGYDNCAIGEANDDGKEIDCDDIDSSRYPNNIEICDGLDNDCNNSTTDGSGETAPLNDNQNGVCKYSVKSCDGVNGWINDYSNVANNEYPAETSCDGFDNNCDGQIDEGCSCVDNQTQACGSDTGECQKGIQTCFSGSWGACVGEITSQTEICNDSKDNDCDNDIDCADADCSGDPDCANCADECSSGSFGCNGENSEWTCGEAEDGDDCLDKIIAACEVGETCSVANGKCESENNNCAVAVNWPSDGEKYIQGDGAWFDASAFGGTAPYSYKWNSDLAGDFSAEQWPNIDTSSWTIGAHIITVTAADSAGKTCSDSIQINIEPSGSFMVNIDMWETEFARDPNNPAWFGAQTAGGSGLFSFEWKSDKLALPFSTEQWASIDVSSWTLGIHNITITVTDTVTSEIAIDVIRVTIVDMSLQVWWPNELDEYYFSENIWFNAGAQGGTLPYFYQWTSDTDGSIGAEAFFQKDNLSLGAHIISVTATDSSITPLSTTKQVSINIILAPTLSISITSPTDNSIFDFNESISFKSVIEGGVSPYVYSWDSNIDGQINTIQNFTKNDLSIGNHVITITVNDKSGQIATESINITVNAPVPPTATINSPASNSLFTQFDDAIIFQGSASGGDSPYTYKWSSSHDGDLGSGGSFMKNDLSVNNHVITFSVTDANNNTDSASVSITVNARVAPNNTKLLANYPTKIMFLISDENWQDVMGLVPLTTWTAQNSAEYASCKHPHQGAKNVCAYPSLIYHKETEDAFDADSIMYFIEQYSPTKIIAVNNLPAELTGAINGKGLTPDIISVSDYLSYWQNYDEIVYVENNYELALIASTYASLQNAPLVIQNSSLDASGTFSGKKVYTVGTVACPAGASQCIAFATKESLEAEYFDSTATDKVMLVNPEDLAITINGGFPSTNYCSNPINNLASGLSLSAPFLASAKHELIISTTKTNFNEVDVFLESKISSLPHMPEYLTIIASPNAIDMHYYNPIAYGAYPSTDQWHYARMNDGDDYLDLAVGRIVGASISDVSATIARTVFYQETLKNPDRLHVGHGMLYEYDPAQVYSYGEVYSMLGYDATVAPDRTSVDDWKNEFYIQYHDHGGSHFAGILNYQIPELDNTFILTTACSTCDFQFYESGSGGIPFCAYAMRKGAIVYEGATDTSTPWNVYSFITDVFTEQLPVGKAFQNSKNLRLAWYTSGYNIMPFETLIGDPTFILNTPYNFPSADFTITETNPGETKYNVTVPAVKVEIPQVIKDMCVDPEYVNSFYISSAGQCSYYNPMYNKNRTVYLKIPYISGFNPTIAQSSYSIATVKIQPEKYYFVKLYENNEPYFFDGASETEFTDFEINFTLSE